MILSVSEMMKGMQLVITAGILLVLFSACGPAGRKTAGESEEKGAGKTNLFSPYPPAADYEESLRLNAARLLSLMTLDERCSQLLIISITANALSEAEAAALTSLKPGGIILFRYNVPDTMEKLQGLTRAVSKAVSARGVRIPPFIAVDHEGGVIHRFRGLLAKLPPAEEVAATMSVAEAKDLYAVSAKELRKAGVTMNFAPILEPLTKDTAPFLSGRSFGLSPDTAAAYGGACVEAMERYGVLAVAKHFPGSGGADPHARTSVIHADGEEFAALVSPFGIVAKSGGLKGVMMSLAYVDETPALFSREIIEELLRKDLGFTGLVVSDDLIMSGLSKSYGMEDAVVLAVAAGCDMLIYSGGRQTALRDSLAGAVKDGRLSLSRVNEAVLRIIMEKLRRF